MKKSAVLAFFCIAALFTLQVALQAQESIEYRIEARLVVYDGGAAGDRLVDWLEAKGGYFLSLENGRIIGRLPSAEAAGAEEDLKNLSAELLGYSLTARDVSGELRRLEASLSSRREVLDQNLSYLARSDFSSTLAIEKEVLDLVGEIESIRAQIASLNIRSTYATLELDLESQGVTNPGGTLSNFSWINSIDFYSFMESNPLNRTFSWLPRFGDPETAPEGFSVYRNSRLYRAVSPEGIKLRIREVRPEPVMDMAFWETALTAYMEEAGYLLRDKQILELKTGSNGLTFMWLAPYSGDEYVYMVALFPSKLSSNKGAKQLKIVEVAGELESFDRRGEALQTWLEGYLE